MGNNDVVMGPIAAPEAGETDFDDHGFLPKGGLAVVEDGSSRRKLWWFGDNFWVGAVVLPACVVPRRVSHSGQ